MHGCELPRCHELRRAVDAALEHEKRFIDRDDAVRWTSEETAR
jgi:hypothetical protein